MKKSCIIMAGGLGLILICLGSYFTYGYFEGKKKNGKEVLDKEVLKVGQPETSTWEDPEIWARDTTNEEISDTESETDEIENLQSFVNNNDKKKVYDLITGQDESKRKYLPDNFYYNESAVTHRSAHINVNYISQLPELPTGCEITSLTTVLNYYGYAVSKETMADVYLPKCGFGDGSFSDYFLGDPRSEYAYGCYARPIVTAANSYLACHMLLHKAVNYSGDDFSNLLNHVAEGEPVVLWITNGLENAYMTAKWDINGRTEQWTAPEHCVVLTGYNLDLQTVTLSDPLKGIVTRNLKTVVNRYNQMHQQAVIIESTQSQTVPSTEPSAETSKEPTTGQSKEPTAKSPTESSNEPTKKPEKQPTEATTEPTTPVNTEPSASGYVKLID